MDHFALPEDDLTRAYDAGTLQRNFMGYTTHADCDLLGLGVSAISHIGDSFSQNPRDLARMQPLVADGLVVLERLRISATSRGRLLLRIIAMCFDRYLTQQSSAQTHYSSAV